MTDKMDQVEMDFNGYRKIKSEDLSVWKDIDFSEHDLTNKLDADDNIISEVYKISEPELNDLLAMDGATLEDVGLTKYDDYGYYTTEYLNAVSVPTESVSDYFFEYPPAEVTIQPYDMAEDWLDFTLNIDGVNWGPSTGLGNGGIKTEKQLRDENPVLERAWDRYQRLLKEARSSEK